MSWPANPTNGQQVQINGILYEFNTSNNTWDRVGGFGVNAFNDAIVANSVQTKDLTVTRSADLGSVADLTISGGEPGYVIITDGAGNLSWVPQALEEPAGNVNEVQFNGGGFAGNENLTFDPITGTLTTVDIAGNLTSSAQPNITTVGTLGALSVTGNIDAGNVIATTFVGNVVGTLSAPGLNTQVLINTQGNVGASTNLTFDGTVLTVTGNIAATKITGTDLVGTMLTVDDADLGNLAVANYYQGVLTTVAQPNIISLGTLTDLSVDGAISISNSVITLDANTYVTGSFIPTTTVTYDNDGAVLNAHTPTYDLGSEQYRWRDLYLSGKSIVLGTTVTCSNNDLTDA